MENRYQWFLSYVEVRVGEENIVYVQIEEEPHREDSQTEAILVDGRTSGRNTVGTLKRERVKNSLARRCHESKYNGKPGRAVRW